MAIDKAATLKSAQQYTAKNQFDKAIAEWQKLISNSPADAAIFNTIGDLHARRNAPSEAVEAYLQAAAFFKASGDALKAIAVYRKVLKLEPQRHEVYRKLGDLNAERGLTSSAIAEYTTLVKLLLKEGRSRDAQQVYRTMTKVDPSNLEVKQRLAELCVQDGQTADAIDAYLDLGRECQQQQRRDQARAAYQAAATLDPGHARVQRALQALDNPTAPTAAATDPHGRSGEGAGRHALLEAAARQIESAAYGDAETALMEMLSREPGDPEVCRLLARLHLKRGELSVARGEFQFLAGAAMRAEDFGLAESMLLEYLDVDPHCPLLKEALGQVYERKGDIRGAVERYSQALSILIEHPDPDQPSLAQDLLGKIKELAPGSELVPQFTNRLKPGATPTEIRDLAGLERLETGRDAGAPEPTTSTPTEVAAGTIEEPPAAIREPMPEPIATVDPPPEPTPEPEPEPLQAAPAPVAAESEPVPAHVEPLTAERQPEPAPEPEPEPVPMAAEGQPVASAPVEPVAAQQPEPALEEIRARYTLGVAYKNMGLFEEAFAELRQTVTIKEFFVDSSCMLGECFKDQGEYQGAMTYYQQALTAVRDEDRATAIRYELALLYESSGQIDKAVQALSALDEYRDAPERLERIKSATASGPEPVLSAAESASVGEPGIKAKKRRVSYL